MTRQRASIGRANRRTISDSGAEKTDSRHLKIGYRKRILLLTLCLIVLALTFLFSGGPQRITNHLAARAMRNHKHASARYWLNIGSVIPSLRQAGGVSQFFEARMARREGNLEEMEGHLSSAVKAGLERSRADRERLYAEVQSGQLDANEYEVNGWLKEGDPDASEICDVYANGLAVVSRLDEALRVLQAWQSDQPEHPVPPYRIGRIFEYYDNTEQAEKSYETSVQNDPEYYPAVFRLASLYLEAKRPRDAKELFEQCLSMSEPLAAEISIALCLIELGETDAARDKLEESLKHTKLRIDTSYAAVHEKPETFIAATELGKLLVNSGELKAGIQWLDASLAENTRDLSARYSRAVAYQQIGEKEKASAEFEEIAKVKKALEKVNILRNQIGRQPTDAAARVELGGLLLKRESERNGIFWLQSALTFDPGNKEAHRLLAEYYASKAAGSPEFASLAAKHRNLAER